MPIIMPKVRRSRRIWMNSLTTMAQNRTSENSSRMVMTINLVRGLFHEVNEDVFEPGADLAPLVLGGAERRDRLFQGLSVVAADMQRGAESGCLPDAWPVAELLGKLLKMRAADRPGRQTRLLDDLGAGAVGEQIAVEDVGEPVTAFRFIHVVGGDQERQPLSGKLMDLLPEIAAGLGVDAGGRLVEQQQLRLVNHARSQRQALFPPAGKMTGQLVLPPEQPQPLETVAHSLATVAARNTCARQSRDSRQWSNLPRS